MKTYNTLTEAVVAAINELKTAGNLSVYQITQLLRKQTNDGEVEILGCEARPNNQNIKFWINHDEVRKTVNELYANNELTALGLISRQYNGTYQEYTFDTSTVPTTDAVVTPVPDNTSTTTVVGANSIMAGIDYKVRMYLDRHIDDVEAPTMKKIQSALKINGITCEDFNNIVLSIGYNTVAGVVGNYSTYYAVKP